MKKIQSTCNYCAIDCNLDFYVEDGRVVKVVPTKLMLDFICRAVGGTPRPSEENPESRFVPRDKVLELVQSPNIIQRYQAFLDYAGRPAYLEYVTRPVFELKLKRLI